jgi:uncharacterized protein (TIGR02145 family)
LLIINYLLLMNTKLHTRFAFVAVLFAALLLMQCSKEFGGVGMPVVKTLAPYDITTNSIHCGGKVEADNGFPVTAFGLLVSDYDDFRKYDSLSCVMDGDANFITTIESLHHNRILYLKAWAVSELGTGYGEVVAYTHAGSGITFNPDLTYDTLTDIDGNSYLTIRIGNQEWMAENLRTTRYRDGTPIPHVIPNEDWDTLSSPAYCWYLNNEAGYKATYGALYNWWAASSGKLCPVGWHAPDSVEWSGLILFLQSAPGMASKHLKEAGSMHWILNNEGDNKSGFTAMPGGYRANSGWFYYQGYFGYYWTESASSPIHGIYITLGVNGGAGVLKSSKQAGLTIRCLRD